jgi:hypothetical protein
MRGGITILDYFAAKAMPEVMRQTNMETAGAYGLVASRSYRMAEAMLAEKAQR